MPQVVPFEQARARRRELKNRDGRAYWRTDYINSGDDDGPNAYIIENQPSILVDPHYHERDQFQVIVQGRGAMGRHPLERWSVHYANAFTTYGPITSSADGLAWLTLRPRRDPGPRMIDTWREALTQQKDRDPFQSTVDPDFAALAGGGTASILGNDQGLVVNAVSVPANGSALAGDPSTSSCQFILVTGGSLVHEGKQAEPMTVVHVGPDEEPFRLQAGPDGLQCLVLGFPREGAAALVPSSSEAQAPAPAEEATAWHCELCGFVYEEAEGLPEAGIPPGTPWSALPADFKCPDCSATKPDFVPLAF